MALAELRKAQEALDARAHAVIESRKLVEATWGAGKEMTGEETEKHAKLKADIVRFGTISKELQELERLESVERARSDERSEEPVRPNPGGGRAPEKRDEEAPWLKKVRSFYAAAQVGAELRMSERVEVRDLAADGGTTGGYTVKKEHLSDLIRALDDVVYIRSKARKIRLDKSDTIDLPTLAGKPTAFVWGTERSKPTRDSNMSYGRRTLKTKSARGMVTSTKKMLRLAEPPAEQTIRDEFKALVGDQEENVFFNGNGANEPLGLMVESDLGLPASRSISTGNTATLVKFDGLIKAKYSIKQQYRKMLEWFFHRDVIAQIATEKDSNGLYLWRNSVALGEPDTILNIPVNESEKMPNTQTASQLVGLLGNLDEFMIADGLDLTIEVLREVFWETDEIGFTFDLELDANVRDVNAFARVKQAA